MTDSRSQPKSIHSPLPWRGDKAGFITAPDTPRHDVQVAKVGNFFDKELLPFNRERWQADIDLIVEAVNSHAALKARIEELEQSVDMLESNARVQAKLLADTGRRAEELEGALRDALCELSACALQMGCKTSGSVHRAQIRARAALQQKAGS